MPTPSGASTDTGPCLRQRIHTEVYNKERIIQDARRALGERAEQRKGRSWSWVPCGKEMMRGWVGPWDHQSLGSRQPSPPRRRRTKQVRY